ncbi:cytidine deaminase-like protein [Russula earlei]|uniref:Cytidine deaminase-like protein n=1 Tax=Russula earlei TaxID=71964 RepID=A0ACC0UN39_9AGAM|nr:cytidine deaminase-like protein [Russula earlei]
MFIAIIGTRLSGKSTVETYLLENEFVPVRLSSQTAQNGQVQLQRRSMVIPSDPDHLFSFIDTDDTSTNTVVDSPTRDVLEVDPDPQRGKLTANSFLSLESSVPSPISPRPPHRNVPDQSLCFTSAEELLAHVTKNWCQNFVTQDLRTEQTIQMFIKRPFFMLISIDAPISDRFRRANNHLAGVSLDAFIIANDADVYGRRSDSHRQNDKPENYQVGYLSPLHSLQKYVTLHVVNNFDTVTALRSYLDNINLLDVDRLRPSWDSYFMTLASLASMRSNCMKRRVGAILVRNKRILATGYNGTPLGLTNCNEGGCARCNGSQEHESCLCLHAEENALLEAGRERVTGATLYCNTCPCLTCTVKIVQTGVKEVVYNLSYKV